MGWTGALFWLLPKRLHSSWPLLLITSFGIIAAVTLMAVGAGYSNILAEGGLRHTLASTHPEILNVHVITQNRPIGVKDYRNLRSTVEDIADTRLGYMTRGMERYGRIEGDIRFTRDPSADPLKLDSIFVRPFFLTGLQEHSRLVDGRWPQDSRLRGNDGAPVSGDTISLEAVLGAETASTMSLGVGDNVDLIPFSTDQSDRISVHIVGLAEPIDSSEEYWMNGPSSYFAIQDLGNRLVAPFYISEEAFFDGIGAKHPSLVGDFAWFLFLNTDVLTASMVGPTKEALDGLETDVNRRFPQSLVFTGLKITLREYEKELLLARVPIFLFISLVVLVVLYFLALVLGLLARSRNDEASLLRSRGASLFQVSAILVVSEGIVAVVAIILGPLLAFVILRYLLLSTIDPVTGTSQPVEVGLSLNMLLMGVLGGLLSLAVLLFSGVSRARLGLAESLRERARPPTLPFLQRYYVDFLVLAAVAFLIWEIQGREGFFIRDLASQDLKLDLVPLFGPVLILVGVAVVVLRLLPLLVKLMAWFAERIGPAWVAFPLARFARDPIPHGSLVVILILASALGVFGATFQSTLSLTQTQRTLYAAGGDLSVTGPTLTVSDGERLAEEPAVEAFSPVVQETGTLLDVFPGALTTLLAVDPKALPGTVWFREDFAGKSLGELLAPLGPSPVGAAAGLGLESLAGIEIPGDARRLGVWVEKSRLNTGPLASNMNLWARVYDDRGRYRNLFLGELEPIKSFGTRMKAPTTAAGTPPEWVYLEGEIPENPYFPVETSWLVSIFLSRNSFTPVPPGSVSFDDLTIKGPSTPPAGVVIEGFEEYRGWVALINEGRVPDIVERTSFGAHSGEAGLSFGWQEPFKETNRGVVLPTDPYPAPAIGSPGFVPGQSMRVKIGKHLLPVVVEDTTKFFPTLNPSTRPFLIVPLDAYSQYVRRTSSERVEDPWEFWVSLKDGADRDAAAASIKDRLGVFVGIRDRDSLVNNALRNPLAGGGWNGLTILGMAAIIMAVLLTLVIHALVAIQTGRVDLTVARTLGLSRLQLFLSLGLERVLVAIVGLAIGSAAGVWMGRWILGYLDVNTRGEPSIPPMILAAQEWLIISVLGGLAAALILGLIVAAVSALRLRAADILRTGE